MKTQQHLTVPTKQACAALAALLLFTQPALAYVGPGLGLATIGAILGAVGAILLAIVGVFWYPVRSMIRKRRAAAQSEGAEDDTTT